MYLICKFSGTWTLFNGNNQTSKALTPQQVDLVKDLFADDLRETALLDSLIVNPISPNKLQQVTAKSQAPSVAKKTP